MLGGSVRRTVRIGLLALGTLCFCASAQAQDESMDGVGRVPRHGSFGLLPWEHIDTYTGNLTLSFTDVVLPGQAGFSLAVRRTFNSHDGWTWGIGPRLDLCGTGCYPAVRRPDGGTTYFFQTDSQTPPLGEYIAADYSRLTITTNDRTLRTPDGVVATFDEDGELLEMHDSYWNLTAGTGNSVEVFYLQDGYQIDYVVQHVGSQTRQLQFAYNDGLLVSITYPSTSGNRVWQYDYGEFDPYLQVPRRDLVTVTLPTGLVWHFTNDEHWDLQAERWNKVLTVTMPTTGWVRYTSSGVLSPALRGEGIVVRERATGVGSTTIGTWDLTYEDLGNDSNGNDLGLETTIQGPSNFVSVHTHVKETPQEATLRRVETGPEVTEFQWRAGATLGVPEGSGDQACTYLPASVAVTRDGHTYTRTYSYDDNHPTNHFGQPWQVGETGDFNRTTTVTSWQSFSSVYLADRAAAQSLQAGGSTYTSSFSYDSTGFLLSKTSRGVTTSFARTASGNVASTTDANNHTTSYTYSWGMPTSVQTPLYTVSSSINEDGTTASATQRNLTTTYTYDAVGRPTRVHPPVGNDTVTAYASDGRSVTVTRGSSSSTTSVDEFGRPVSTIDSQGVQTRTSYDAWGRTAQASYPSASGSPTGVSFQYDSLGRLTSRTNDADNSSVVYAYGATSNGLTVTITDENGHATTQLWQASGTPSAGRLAAVTDADGHTTSYTYTGLGGLAEVSQPGNVTRTWTYNSQHRVTSQSQPESGTTAFEYDNAGNVTARTDASSRRTEFSYDANNRLTQVNTLSDSLYATTFTYDASNNRLTATNHYVASTFTFDDANRAYSRTDQIRLQQNGTPRTFSTSYTYDDNDNVTAIAYPSGNHVSYSYDSENRITRVFDTTRNLVFADSITYHLSGPLAGYASGDNIGHTVELDARQRPSRVGATNVLAIAYERDAAGNVTGSNDTAAISTVFGYDALNRLTGATAGSWGTVTYGYDPLGNRTAKDENGLATSYGYTSQRLTSLTTGQQQPDALTYDLVGNLAQDPTGTYTYTATNMLATATVGGTAVYTYRYDADSQRVLKLEGGVRATYYLRGLGDVLSEYVDEGGELTWTVDYVRLGPQLLAGVRPFWGISVTKAGSGVGSVTASPAGISCGGTCWAAYANATAVTLTATAAAGSTFAGWSGSCSGSDPTATVTVTGNMPCTATFTSTQPKLTVIKSGSGAGTVTSAPGSLSCGDTCQATFEANTEVTLTATAASGSYFGGWSGECAGASTTSTVTMSTSKTCVATFFHAMPGHLLTITTVGPGTVTIWATPPCGSGCAYMYPTGTSLTLTPTPASGYAFAGWSGDADCADGSVTMSADRACTATFGPLFTKQTPANHATGLGSPVTLQWTTVPEDGYSVCWDTIDNGACDTTWYPNGGATSRQLTGLTAGTYYWQVKTAGEAVQADGGTWWGFTVESAPLFTKQTPTNGATGLGSPVTLQWTTVPEEGYWVCWDTSDNGTCDTAWYPNGGATWRQLTDLAAGTYYWQVKTVGGVFADNGTWWHFTVGGAGPHAATVVARPRPGGRGPGRAWPLVVGVVIALGVGWRQLRRRMPSGRATSPAEVATQARRPGGLGRGSPWRAGPVARIAGLVLLLMGGAAVAANGQDPGQNPTGPPTCARGLQGYVRLFDDALVTAKPLRRAVVELRTEPHDTLLDRVHTDVRGWFKFPGGLPRKGTPFRLHISAPGAASVTLKLTLDPGCRNPVIVLAPAKGGAQ